MISVCAFLLMVVVFWFTTWFWVRGLILRCDDSWLMYRALAWHVALFWGFCCSWILRGSLHALAWETVWFGPWDGKFWSGVGVIRLCSAVGWMIVLGFHFSFSICHFLPANIHAIIAAFISPFKPFNRCCCFVLFPGHFLAIWIRIGHQIEWWHFPFIFGRIRKGWRRLGHGIWTEYTCGNWLVLWAVRSMKLSNWFHGSGDIMYWGLTNWYLREPNRTWIRLCPLPFPLGLVVWGRDEGMNSWIRLVFDVRIRDSVHYRVQFEPWQVVMSVP